MAEEMELGQRLERAQRRQLGEHEAPVKVTEEGFEAGVEDVAETFGAGALDGSRATLPRVAPAEA